ncbi:MAG: RNA-directed DNA polymerase [Chloroflexia bacterium]|nr:RNA-directed DNA polymerase [Chloroflexia bacterium]
MTAASARQFLLKESSYRNFDLPPYFSFNSVLRAAETALGSTDFASICASPPRDSSNVNYTILNNKDGRYAWRALELIHPVLYVSLVKEITDESTWKVIQNRFEEFAACKRIRCLSIPVQSRSTQSDRAEQILQWWQDTEQPSIELALDYEYVVHVDIADCYSDIYTHSIAWAIHGKDFMKDHKNRNDKSLIGNVIDRHIQGMRHGQTNGIPQGSVLMDFVAEMVLGYADLELTEGLRESRCDDCLVLRYRDDYRIFTNSSQVAEHALKCLTETLIGLGLKLNTGKTQASSDVITSSVKPDKLAWVRSRQCDDNLVKHLLLIHGHSLEFPNSGSVSRALTDYYQRLEKTSRVSSPMPLVSICVDIAYRNPRTYPICAAILSCLLKYVGDEREAVIEKIARRFAQLPNTGYLEIWLQRISDPSTINHAFREPLCKLVCGENVDLWDNAWISSKKVRNAVGAALIIDLKEAKERKPIIQFAEVLLFKSIREVY